MQIVCPFLFAALTSFAFAMGCWALWGLTSQGDLFANGNSLVYPSLFLAAGVGAWAGYKARSAWLRSLLLVAAFAALYFFVFVPDGWWVSPLQNRQQQR
jgi:hypothetical protein